MTTYYQNVQSENTVYHNDPKFLDRQVWANSADPDQTAPRGAVWSGSTLFAILSASFGLITLWQSHIVQILECLQQIFWVSEYLGNSRYVFYLNNVETFDYWDTSINGKYNTCGLFKSW